MSDGAPSELLSLDACAAGTDKRSGLHGYTRYYERLLAGRSIRAVLEIGVLKGGSLRMWAARYPEARVDGIECDPSRLASPIPHRVRVFELRQEDRAAVRSFAEHEGPWDLIVDDGSHVTSHQLASFGVLWPFVRAGGLYVIEDAFAGFLPEFADLGGTTLYQRFFDLVCEKLRGAGTIGYSDHARTDVDFIEFSTGLIAVSKRSC